MWRNTRSQNVYTETLTNNHNNKSMIELIQKQSQPTTTTVWVFLAELLVIRIEYLRRCRISCPSGARFPHHIVGYIHVIHLPICPSHSSSPLCQPSVMMLLRDNVNVALIILWFTSLHTLGEGVVILLAREFAKPASFTIINWALTYMYVWAMSLERLWPNLYEFLIIFFIMLWTGMDGERTQNTRRWNRNGVIRHKSMPHSQQIYFANFD